MTDTNNSRYCTCHPKHDRILQDHDKALYENSKQHNQLWDAIKDVSKSSVPIKFFVLLVAMVIGNLGFQLIIYDKLNQVDKTNAVIESRINAMQDDKYHFDPKDMGIK